MSILLKQWTTGLAGGKNWSSYWTTRTPSALVAVPYSATRIDLSWTNGADTDYDGISIEGSTDGTNYTEYETVAAGESTANITGLDAITDYYFRIKAYKGTNYSDPTTAVQSYTLPAELTDGHTLLWIPYEDSSLYSLSDSAVLEVTDKLGSGRKFIGGTNKPVLNANGIYFNAYAGFSASMAATFNFNAVYTMYLVFAAHTFRSGVRIMTYGGSNGGLISSDDNTHYRYYNGAATGGYPIQEGKALGTYMTAMCGCNGPVTTGMFRIDDNVAFSGHIGVSNHTSITLSALGSPPTFETWTLKEIILRDVYEYGTAALTNIYNYLAKKKP